LYGKYRDNEYLEKETRKELEKERPSSSAITFSQYFFKVEVKVDIKSYQVEIDVVKIESIVTIDRSLF